MPTRCCIKFILPHTQVHLLVKFLLKRNYLNKHRLNINFKSGLQNHLLKWFCICLLLALQLYSLHSQQTVEVKIVDAETAHPIPFAAVQIKNTDSVVVFSGTSNAYGKVKSIPPGEYSINIQVLGYFDYSANIEIGRNTIVKLKPEQIELDQVVVTGQFKPQAIDKSIYDIKLVDRKEIDLIVAQNLGEALKNQPGIQMQNEGVLGGFINIRGLGGEHVKILIDGMPISGRVGGVIDLGQINMQNVKHIEVVEGPMSVVYGNNALAGVVNIITKNPQKNTISGNLAGYYETAGTYNFDGLFSYGREKHGISINLARNFFEGWNPTPTERYRLFKPKLQYLGGIQYSYNFNKLAIQLKSDLIHEELRHLDSIPKVDFTGKVNDIYYFAKRFNNRLNGTYNISENLGLTSLAGYSYFNRVLHNYENNLTKLNKFIHSGDTTIFHLVTHRTSFHNSSKNKFHYQLGYDLNYERATGERTNGVQTLGDFAGFVNLIYQPIEALEVQPGIRLIYHTKYNAPLVYSLNLKYSFAHLNFKASYGKGFRAPSLKELYLDFQDVNHNISGNENLEAEISNNISVSLEYRKNFSTHGLNLNTSVFYNSIDNAIDLAIDPDRPTWGKYFNITGQPKITSGLDGSISYSSPIRIRPTVGFSLIKSSVLDSPGKFTSHNNLKFGLDYNYPKLDLRFGAYYNIYGENIQYRGTFDAEGTILGVEEYQIPGYQMMDLTIEKAFFKKSMITSVGVKNILNVTLLETSTGSGGVHSGGDGFTPISYGRTFFVKLLYNFNFSK